MNRHLNLVVESDIEKKLKREVEKIGAECFKFVSPGNPGVPDRIVLFNNYTYFIECKRPEGGVYSALQLNMHKRFIKHGQTIWKVHDDKQLSAFIKFLKTQASSFI
jgi:hypothetical protein